MDKRHILSATGVFISLKYLFGDIPCLSNGGCIQKLSNKRFNLACQRTCLPFVAQKNIEGGQLGSQRGHSLEWVDLDHVLKKQTRYHLSFK